ncbi:unnamed protein product [Paramecium sonneborni]|uniref:Uncharacterized protein n=1 Tax=Paramecium sonneborni TaxID=65129 RepID=A0A8S1QB88_9CILI|nr:unnamed protein product [Paramecium sonneborni]
MKISVNNCKHQLIISVKDERFQQVENKIKEFPKQLISYREFPYSVTDKRTEINYIVNKIEGGISVSFQKTQLIDYDPQILIESLKLKIEEHLQIMVRIFWREGELKEILIQKIIYSPTDLEFNIQYGKMLNCQFYLSKIIGNCLMSKKEDCIHIYLIKSEILDGFTHTEFLKAPPLNLNILVQQKDIWSIGEILHNTFLTSQLIQQILVECNCISSLIINQYYHFIPTKELGIFVFKINSAYLNQQHLIVSLCSKIVNNKIQIYLREAVQYSMLMELQKIDINKYFDDLKFLKFEEFERINDFWDFIQKFFITTLAYTFFYDTKFLQLQIFQKLRHLQFFQKVQIPIIQNIQQLKSIIHRRGPHPHLDLRQICQIFQNLNDKYLHIYFIRYTDDVPKLSHLMKIYQEKIDDQIQRLKSINNSFDHEINQLANKLFNISIELNTYETSQFVLKIQGSQNGHLEYKFSKQFIVKKYLAKEEQWPTFEFPHSEEYKILNSF